MTNELTAEELKDCLYYAFEGMWAANYGTDKAKEKQAYTQLVKLIEEKEQQKESEVVDEEIMTWLDGEYISMGHALGMLLVPDSGEHFTDSELVQKANLEWGQSVIERIKQLLSRQQEEGEVVER